MFLVASGCVVGQVPTMKLFRILLMSQAVWLTSASYHELSSKPFSAPPGDLLPDNALFGYSFAYLSSIRSIIISAPKADNIGRLYSCDIDFKTNCTVIQTNIERENKNYTHDYWLGASVKASSDLFYTCAPRYVSQLNYKKIPGEFGHCYKSKGNDLQALGMITDEDRKRNTDKTKIQEQMDSFGWSIDISDMETPQSILIGGPAMFTGRVMKIASSDISSINGRDLKSKDGIKFNLGHSIATLNRKGSVYYAVGSSYGADGHGKVVFFKDNWRPLPFSLEHASVGTMFGAVLASALIHNTHTALLVGAPTHATHSTYNVGAVYYYETAVWGRSMKPKETIEGQKPGAHFGSAIVSVGDLNGDGRHEIAIAAPYEDDGRGAVYLYCGSYFVEKTSSSKTWLQRIQPEHYRAFGLSLSALSDYDGNGCNELAIGAPDSNAVVLYRCMSSVVVTVFAKFPDLQDRTNIEAPYPDRNETYFIFQSCMNVKYPNKVKDVITRIEVNVELSHSHAALASPAADGKYEVSLHERREQYCRDVGVSMPPEGKYNSKIFYKIEARLLDSPMDHKDFDVRSLILSEQSKLIDSNYVWAAECKDKKSCAPNLTLEFQCSSDTPIIASNSTMTVKLNIHNSGEIAYDAFVTVLIEGAPLKKIPDECAYTSNSNELACERNVALRTATSWTTEEIIIQTQELTNKDKFINIKARLYENRVDTTKFKDYYKTIPLKASSEAIFVTGRTNIGDVVNMTTSEVSTTGKLFEHIYIITNNGLPNWIDVSCELILPRAPYIDVAVKDVVAVKPSELSCVFSDKDKDHISAKCTLNSILYKMTSVITVTMRVKPDTLDDTLASQNVTVQTTLNLFFDDRELSKQVSTVLVLRDISVPWWVIFLATLIGILILLILVLILRQCGFLQRKERKKLKHLRESIRRQTIRRSMMVQQSEDRRRFSEMGEIAEETMPVCSPGVDETKSSIINL